MPARTARGSAGQRLVTSAKFGDSRARSAEQDAKFFGRVSEGLIGFGFAESVARSRKPAPQGRKSGAVVPTRRPGVGTISTGVQRLRAPPGRVPDATP